MKTNFIIFLLLLASFTQAQNYRYIYDVIYKKDSTSEMMTKENYNLDINKDEILYYTRDYFIADSLINNNIPFPNNSKLNTSNILRHKPGSNDFEDYDLLENTILKLQTKDSQLWKLTDEKKQINQLKVQKATSRWGGRNWTAWFCEELPFQEGPYKFRGLPGLIVELYDDKGNYRFELVKSEKINTSNENQFIAAAKQMGTPVTWEKYKSSKLKYYESPVNFIKNAMGTSQNSEFFLNDGTVVNSVNARDINASLRNVIKKYNNPIELNRMINYP